MYVAWRQIDWETFTLWLQDLKKNPIWQRSNNNYHNIDISIKKRTKEWCPLWWSNYEINWERSKKKNGKKYVMQIQKETKKTVKEVRDRNNALLQTKNNKGWKRSASPRGPRKKNANVNHLGLNEVHQGAIFIL